MELRNIGFVLIVLNVLQGALCQGNDNSLQPQCEQGSCYPATGDLLIGREANLTANSTCGLDRQERYCIVSHLDEAKKCFLCDSRRPWSQNSSNSHRVENIVSSFRERKFKWWQAENGVQRTYIQLDLEAEFHFTHLIMTFKTFRPKAMYIERSYDFGNSWKIYRYFAYDCSKSFPGVPTGPVRKLTDVICASRYSDVVPSTEGEVIFRVLPPFIRINDPYAQDVQDLLKLTNLRVVFTELHTLGDIVFDSRPDIKEKYYYAMYDMTVRGSCSCYGHASRCIPVYGYDSNPLMVNGQCECTHNTMGLNCEQCKDFYNDKPWRPAQTSDTNACEKCECYNHATACHFDAGVYELTGRQSGGVCDECQHNTMGRNCQECLPFYFQDPNRDLRDPEICQVCDCDPAGSLYDGECEPRNDAELGTVAGRCLCKTYVTGRRCDSCVEGYWNLQDDNPNGCDACTCDPMGTLENFGCDQYTGYCTCKRFVTGKNCDQCYPGFWGMSNDLNGCRPCDCDVGGATSEECDVTTGQCSCKPNIQGRQCHQVQPGYFFTRMDWYTYEAEFADGIGNTRVFIREPVSGYRAWTGPGYMRIMEGDALRFTGINVDFPMFYDIVIRYDPRMTERWEDVRVSVIRPGPTDPDGPCANAIPQDDNKVTMLQPGARFVSVTPTACLENGVNYTIRIEFRRYKSDRVTPDATALIDSIVLMPNTDSIPIFQGPGLPEYMKNEYMRYRCRELQLHVHQPELPELCKKHVFSISGILHHRALECDCDLTGSLSFECDMVGGQCKCKDNVVGRRCDQCAPGTYGFGPNGCKPCNCHAIGARDNFCDIETGQCLCIPNVHRRICEQCQPGFYGFPYCRACDCNGNAETCDDLTGACHNCTDYTAGERCERCLDGYYGDPRLNVREPCRPCMCPKGPNHPAQHADSCFFDPRLEYVVCQCDTGYKGPDCATCDENYFGSPTQINGTCDQCDCSGNIDPDDVGNCDPSTGECLKCLFHTEGFNCEVCEPGFYGNALNQNCIECICNQIGTNLSAGFCNRDTGQCPCLPNVVGKRCDMSAPGFWNMTPGNGSIGCLCDPDGSFGIECNEVTGQCDCRPGRGGRTCSECENLYWGDPNDKCYPCDCDNQGSAQLQCDRKSGQCVCLLGISGYKCDRCDRGTTGELPNCVPCGDCFDNWDRIVRDLRGQTNILMEKARNIQIEGASGAFDKEFRVMEENLAEVRKIIASAGVSSYDVEELEKLLNKIRLNLTANVEQLDSMDEQLEFTMERVQQGNSRIASLQLGVQELNRKAEQLRRNASDIQAQDVEGAFNITREAQLRSQDAQALVDGTAKYLADSAEVRGRVESLLEVSLRDFNASLDSNMEELRKLDADVIALSDKITDINTMVCDGAGNPCDDVCGGGGCGKCGGASCGQGASQKAVNALDLATKAEAQLRLKEQNAQGLATNVTAAHDLSQMARQEAQMAFDEASKAKKASEDTRSDLEKLINKVKDFMRMDGASPDNIEQMANEVLAMTISLQPEQVQQLAQKINDTIQGLQNIDDILEDTREDLSTAQRLKMRAENASRAAAAILETAQGVLKALNGSKEAQDKALIAIEKADSDINNAQTDLTQIESETTAAEEKSRKTMDNVDSLQQGLEDLQKKINENNFHLQNAENTATEAANLANRAATSAQELENRYPDVLNRLNIKYNSTANAKSRVEQLRMKADKMATESTTKLLKLKSMNQEFTNYEEELAKLTRRIDEYNANMTKYLEEIQRKANDYRTCTT
ncbi:laminin subunit beta-1-like [Dreissena polymorpha]|uniref:laminin subunit beta-1-like n=1 Tax=Dreissena polymorpha TaxID=45954 RepID=UPI002264EED7|nr:laminin subunit beta-1-like [Dreissena polymorpha]XP_052278978.1 laminin subunit beta-1-like [Dreissena polymorpha]